MAALGRIPPPLLAALALAAVVAFVLAARAWRRGDRRAWVLLVPSAALSAGVVAAVQQMEASGTATFGWPLVWAIPVLTYRLLGLPLDYEVAFAFGFPLSLAANVATVVATAYAGLIASGRRAVGLGAALALAVWPLVSVLVAGERAWDNGSWLVDTGLALYTEPVSTALVVGAALLLLLPSTQARVGGAGLLLGLATAVKLSNGVVALVLVVVVAALRSRRDAALLAVGTAVFAAVAVAYYPLGYYDRGDDQPSGFPEDPFSLDYAGDNWLHSTLFSPRTLVVLVPLAALGAWALRRRPYPLAVLGAVALGNAAFYSFYELTWEHPRFLFLSLPPLFVLWAAGLAAVLAATARRLR